MAEQSDSRAMHGGGTTGVLLALRRDVVKSRSVPEIMEGWKELDPYFGSLPPRESLTALYLCIGLRLPVPVVQQLTSCGTAT